VTLLLLIGTEVDATLLVVNFVDVVADCMLSVLSSTVPTIVIAQLIVRWVLGFCYRN